MPRFNMDDYWRWTRGEFTFWEQHKLDGYFARQYELNMLFLEEEKKREREKKIAEIESEADWCEPLGTHSEKAT